MLVEGLHQDDLRKRTTLPHSDQESQKQCSESLTIQPLGEAEVITLPVSKKKEDEPVTILINKLEMIVDDSETFWFYSDSPVYMELILKECQEVYASLEV